MTALFVALAVWAVLLIALGIGQATGLIRDRTPPGVPPRPRRVVQLRGLGLAFGGFGLLVLSMGNLLVSELYGRDLLSLSGAVLWGVALVLILRARRLDSAANQP